MTIKLTYGLYKPSESGCLHSVFVFSQDSTDSIMADENKCIKCGREVRARQHGIMCDLCEKWQHRICDTGISNGFI